MARSCAAIFALLLATLSVAMCQDVIIVGAGLSGIAAAVELTKLGMNVLVIEARNRTGGRLWTETVQPARGTSQTAQPPEVVLDYGAMWIHGGIKDRANPVAQLADAFNMTIYTEGQDATATYQGPNHITAANQSITDEATQAFDEWQQDRAEDDLDCEEAGDRGVSLDDEVGTFMREFRESVDIVDVNVDVSYNLLSNALERNIVQEYAGSLRNLSACFWRSETGELSPGDGWLGSTGYMKMVDALIASSNLNDSIVLEQVVTAIDYSATTLRRQEGNILVTAKGPDGTNSLYSAPYVLVTVPLGVLKGADVAFTPPLPAAKQDAIKYLQMGILDKVFLLFNDVFWDEDAFWLERVVPNKEVGKWTGFVTPYMYTKQPLLVAFIAGDSALAAEQEPNLNATVKSVLAALETMYPGKVPALEDIPFYARYFWGKDVFSRGSYSYVGVGASGKERDALAAPVEVAGFGPRLFFAGEATNRQYPSTVHGALLSGRDAANDIIRTA